MNQYAQRNRYHTRRRRRKRTKQFTRGMRITLFIVFVSFLILFGVLFVRIYSIDKNEGDRYRKAALSQHAYTNTVLNYQRGTIRDRNHTTMAVSIRKYDLVLEAKTLLANDEYRAVTLNAVSEYFSFDKAVLDRAIAENPTSMYVHVDGLRQLDSKLVENFKEKTKNNKEVKGIWFEETYTRSYPLGSVACSLIGFLSSDETGSYGVEESYNDVLSGTTGREYGYFDSDMTLQRTIKEATDGNSIMLTIDANVQQILEQEIKDFQKNGVGAERIGVMMMNPKNGEILAMSSDNIFDLNQPQDLSAMYTQSQIQAMSNKKKNKLLLDIWANFCISSAYEPGSTFKPFTVAAALDENLVNESSTFYCRGVKKVADRDIRCNNRSGHKTVDLRHSLMESCNVALMEIGQKLGRTKFFRYNKLFGFGQRTGVDLPGEASGVVFSKEQLNPVELSISSFGQTQTVTMVQMLSGFCSLVNGGNYYQPHIVKEIQNSNGDVVESIAPVVVKKTVSEGTSRQIRSFLKSTVEKGTASPAKVKGYSVGGKTGTAQKHKDNKVLRNKYLVSFIGCVPAEDPEVAIYVIMDEPHVRDQAHSTFATEFASRIMKKVLPFLGQYVAK